MRIIIHNKFAYKLKYKIIKSKIKKYKFSLSKCSP